MEERETSAPKRQKLVGPVVGSRCFTSKKTDDLPLYDILNLLYPFLELPDVDRLVSVSHSMRYSIFKSDIVSHVQRLVKSETKPTLELSHQIYELSCNKIIGHWDCEVMMTELGKNLPSWFTNFTSTCATDRRKIASVLRSEDITDNDLTLAIFYLVRKEIPLNSLGYSLETNLKAFDRFNWNDRKRIFEAMKKAQKTLFTRKLLAKMAMRGASIEYQKRILTFLSDGKNGLSFGSNMHDIGVVNLNLRAISHIPELVKPIMEYFLVDDVDILQNAHFPFTFEMLDSISFGDYFVNNCSTFLKKGNYKFFTGICCMNSFQTEKCCDLWKNCGTRKKYRSLMIEYTPILAYISKLSTAKDLVPLLNDLDEEDREKFWKTQYRQLPLQSRADLVFERYERTEPPEHLYFQTTSETKFSDCRASHSLSLYLLKCERIMNKVLLEKLEKEKKNFVASMTAPPKASLSKQPELIKID